MSNTNLIPTPTLLWSIIRADIAQPLASIRGIRSTARFNQHAFYGKRDPAFFAHKRRHVKRAVLRVGDVLHGRKHHRVWLSHVLAAPVKPAVGHAVRDVLVPRLRQEIKEQLKFPLRRRVLVPPLCQRRPPRVYLKHQPMGHLLAVVQMFQRQPLMLSGI